MLKSGSPPSDEIYRLTEQLVSAGYLDETRREFDAGVDMAVRAFQASETSLEIDGIVGPATTGRLRAAVGGRRIDQIIVHHTAGSRSNTVAEIDAYHRRKYPSWGQIAYQYVLRQHRDGLPLVEICKGRPHSGGPWLDLPGTHTYGTVNYHSIGVVCVGHFDNEPMPPAMYRTLVTMCATWCVSYGLTSGDVYGHREKAGNSTACPGGLVDLAQLRADIGAVIEASP